MQFCDYKTVLKVFTEHFFKSVSFLATIQISSLILLFFSFSKDCSTTFFLFHVFVLLAQSHYYLLLLFSSTTTFLFVCVFLHRRCCLSVCPFITFEADKKIFNSQINSFLLFSFLFTEKVPDNNLLDSGYHHFNHNPVCHVVRVFLCSCNVFVRNNLFLFILVFRTETVLR